MVFAELPLSFTHRLHGTEESGSVSFYGSYGFWISIEYCHIFEDVGKVSSISHQPLIYTMLRVYRKLVNTNDLSTMVSFRDHFIGIKSFRDHFIGYYQSNAF